MERASCWAVSELPGDQGQSKAPLMSLFYQCPYTVQRCGVQTSDICRGWDTGKHSWLVAGAVRSHKRAIVLVGRGGKTGNSSCSASAKFYNSLDECKKKKKKAFYLCSQGGKIQFFQHCWVALRYGTPKLMKSRKLLHFFKTALSTLG